MTTTTKAPAGFVHEAVLTYLRKNAGSYTAVQVTEATGLNYHAVRYALAALAEQGQLVRFRPGREFVYARASTSRAAAPSPAKEPEAVSADVEALKAKLAELEAFREQAVARHPDLAPRDYELYRGALIEFYRVAGWLGFADELNSGGKLVTADHQRIDGLIAAARLIAQIEGWTDANAA